MRKRRTPWIVPLERRRVQPHTIAAQGRSPIEIADRSFVVVWPLRRPPRWPLATGPRLRRSRETGCSSPQAAPNMSPVSPMMTPSISVRAPSPEADLSKVSSESKAVVADRRVESVPLRRLAPTGQIESKLNPRRLGLRLRRFRAFYGHGRVLSTVGPPQTPAGREINLRFAQAQTWRDASAPVAGQCYGPADRHVDHQA